MHSAYETGGTEVATRNLLAAADGYHHILVTPGILDPGPGVLRLGSAHFEHLVFDRQLIRPRTKIGGLGADLSCPASEAFLAWLIDETRPDLVHFHHLQHWDSLLLPMIASAKGIPTAISVHDHFLWCPIHTQQEWNSRLACQRARCAPDQRCHRCLVSYGIEGIASPLALINARNEMIRQVLEACQLILVPSAFSRKKLQSAFPTVPGQRIQTLVHGVDTFPSQANDRNDNRIRLGYFGGGLSAKGADLVEAIAFRLDTSRFSLHVSGFQGSLSTLSGRPGIHVHGPYRREALAERLAEVDVVLVPSQVEESFSLILSEAWAMGRPVLASRLGAMGDRVSHGVDGWLLDPNGIEPWVEAINALTIEKIQKLKAGLANTQWPSTTEVGFRYRQHLDDLCSSANRSAPLRSTQQRPGCIGLMRDRWAPSQYRIRWPLQALSDQIRSDRCQFGLALLEKWDELDPAVISSSTRVLSLPLLSDWGLEKLEWLAQHASLHLIIDDNWLQLPEGSALAKAMPDFADRFSQALALADVLIYTTSQLEQKIPPNGKRHYVIQNALPDSLWGHLATHRACDSPGKIRVGWAGANDHEGDLALVSPVIRSLAKHVSWVIFGPCPKELRPYVSEVVEPVAFHAYPSRLASLKLDVAIAPLTDSAFGQCKSPLKVLEFGALGVPVITSDVTAYRNIPHIQRMPAEPSAWAEALVAHTSNLERRQESGQRLREWVRSQHMLSTRLPHWRHALQLNG